MIRYPVGAARATAIVLLMPSQKTQAPPGKCKGTLLVNLRAFLNAKAGEQAWNELVAAADGEDARLLDSQLLVSSWYPVGAWNRIVGRWLSKSANPSADMQNYARYVADRDLNTVMKLVLSIATPELIVARTSMFWSRYFDCGVLKPTELAPRSWTLTITGPKAEDEAPAAFTCGDGVTGWVEHALRLAGAKEPHVTHTRCRFNGAPECMSLATW